MCIPQALCYRNYLQHHNGSIGKHRWNASVASFRIDRSASECRDQWGQTEAEKKQDSVCCAEALRMVHDAVRVFESCTQLDILGNQFMWILNQDFFMRFCANFVSILSLCSLVYATFQSIISVSFQFLDFMTFEDFCTEGTRWYPNSCLVSVFVLS